jgi:hypothetical protein
MLFETLTYVHVYIRPSPSTRTPLYMYSCTVYTRLHVQLYTLLHRCRIGITSVRRIFKIILFYYYDKEFLLNKVWSGFLNFAVFNFVTLIVKLNIDLLLLKIKHQGGIICIIMFCFDQTFTNRNCRFAINYKKTHIFLMLQLIV